MKYFSLAIVAAVLCAAVVSAAPSSPNPTFEELAFENEFDQMMEEYALNLQCIRDVIGKEMKKSDIGDRWDRMRDEFDRLFSEKWTKCNKKDFRDKLQCRAKIIRQGAELFKDFMRKMGREYKELFMRIREKVMDKCMKQKTFFEEEFKTHNSLLVQFQCMIDVLGKVSKDNGLNDLWTRNKPEIKTHLDNWKRCGDEENKLAMILCNIREGVWTYKLMADYLRVLATENPKVIKEFVRQVKKECQNLSEEEEEFDLMVEEFKTGEDLGEKLKCMMEVIRDAVKDTDFEKIVEKMKREMEDVGNRMKSCQTEQDRWEAAKCIRKELGRARDIFVDFMRRLGKENRKTWERILGMMKERCFA